MPSPGLCSCVFDVSLQRMASITGRRVHCNVKDALKQKYVSLHPTVLLQPLLSVLVLVLFVFYWLVGWLAGLGGGGLADN